MMRAGRAWTNALTTSQQPPLGGRSSTTVVPSSRSRIESTPKVQCHVAPER